VIIVVDHTIAYAGLNVKNKRFEKIQSSIFVLKCSGIKDDSWSCGFGVVYCKADSRHFSIWCGLIIAPYKMLNPLQIIHCDYCT